MHAEKHKGIIIIWWICEILHVYYRNNEMLITSYVRHFDAYTFLSCLGHFVPVLNNIVQVHSEL